MTDMKEKAQRIREVARQALYNTPNDQECEVPIMVATLREVVIEVILKYMQYAEWEIVHKIMEDINELADELEAL
jgi:hypothetical protein